MYPPFQEHVLNAPDVCSNCFRTIRRERAHTESRTLRGDVSVTKSAFTRVRQTTSVEYPPGRTATDSIAVFCDCGTESAFDRVWSELDIDRDRFRTLIKHLLRTLDRKAVSVDRQALAAHALAAFDERPAPAFLGTYIVSPTPTINDCLARGLKHGIQRSLTTGASASKRHPLSGD